MDANTSKSTFNRLVMHKSLQSAYFPYRNCLRARMQRYQIACINVRGGNGFAHRFAISMAIFTFLTMHSALKMLHMPPPTPGTWIYAGMSISKNVTTFSLYFKWILLQIDFRMGCKTALTSLLRFHAHMNFNHEFWWCDHTNIDFKTLCRNHLKA